MTARSGEREIAVLLPLAAGLILVALPYVVPVGPVTVVVDVVTLLALGAVLPQQPWRTGAIAAFPTIVGAGLRAAGESPAVFALAVIGSAIVVAIFTLLVKGGAMFRRPAGTNEAGDPEDRAQEGGRRRWRPFETKAQRGRFLIVVAVLLLIVSSAHRAAFCANAPDPSVELPENYVGSAEHVEDLRRLRSQAPTELRDDLDLITTHFDNTVNPSDPDSQLTENFPEDVNAAIARVTAYIDENCVA